MKLKDTVALMTSDDYKDRFKAEYYQLKIRYEKLADLIARFESGTLDFLPDCGICILAEQGAAMLRYLRIMETRAKAEGIEL